MTDFTGLGAVASFAQDIADRIFPDKIAQEKERADFLLKATELDNQLAQSQIDVNKTEAASENIFVSGWRPFIGWVCGAAFVYHMILQPFITYVYALRGVVIVLPVFDSSMLNATLMGLLGLGAMRTVEKVQAIKSK